MNLPNKLTVFRIILNIIRVMLGVIDLIFMSKTGNKMKQKH